MKSLIPSGKKLLVLREEAQDKTPGGILLPDQAKEKPQRGKVVSIGEYERSDEDTIDFKEGDTVFFAKWGGHEIEIDGKNYIVLNDADVLAILR